MNKFILSTIATIAILGCSSAQALDPAVWSGLVSTVLSKGHQGAYADYISFNYSKGTSFDVTQDRSVEYFSVLARKDELGNLRPSQSSTVEEVWARKNGNWEVRQLIRYIKLNGELAKVIQSVHVISDEHKLISSESSELSVTDAAQIESFEKKIVEWNSFGASL